jgi:hypothetical protein
MPRGRKRKNKEEETEEEVKGKVAKIGEFATPKEEAPEEIPPEAEEIPEEEVPLEEAPKEISPEELKEKLISLLSEAFSRGLPEEEKKKFVDDFKFWNELLFNFLDIGNNLGSVLEKAKVQLTPGKAVALYAIGTGALLFALRPNLLQKIAKKGKPEEQKPPETPPPSKEEPKVEEKPENK